MNGSDLEAACAEVCPHCAAGNKPRFRSDTKEWCHNFAAQREPIDTPSLAERGGPRRMHPGTFAHTFCLATSLRNGASS